jgi:dCMP deaminase
MRREYRPVKGRKRISEIKYYLGIARVVAARSTCLRRNFGAVIVREKQIVSTGYGGAPRGTANCNEMGICVRQMLGAAKGEHYEWCRAVHAEQNAIIHASRYLTMGANLYLVGLDYETQDIVSDAEPCHICKRMIINAGITKVYILSGEKEFRKIDVIKEWIKKNLGEIKRVRGKWVPVMPQGYSYGS